MNFLPLQELQQVEFTTQNVKELMNDLLKDGLTEELILEGKRRKEEDCMSSVVALSPAVGPRPELRIISSGGAQETIARRSSGFTTPDTEYAICKDEFQAYRGLNFVRSSPTSLNSNATWPDLSQHDRRIRCHDTTKQSYETTEQSSRLLLSIPAQSPSSQFFGSVPRSFKTPSEGAPMIISPGASYVGPSNMPQSATSVTNSQNATSTPLNISLQNQILTSLQRDLEAACYEFVNAHYPTILWRKPLWAESPHAAELTRWTAEIIRELQRDTYRKNSEIMYEELISALTALSSVRHDAVHRNNVDAEKILGYIRLSTRLVQIFRTWVGTSLQTLDTIPSYTSSGQQSRGENRDGPLLELQRRLTTLEKTLQAVIEDYVTGRQTTWKDEEWTGELQLEGLRKLSPLLASGSSPSAQASDTR